VEVKEKLERLEGRVSSHDNRFGEQQEMINATNDNVRTIQDDFKSFEERLEECNSKCKNSNQTKRRCRDAEKEDRRIRGTQ